MQVVSPSLSSHVCIWPVKFTITNEKEVKNYTIMTSAINLSLEMLGRTNIVILVL